MKAVIIAAGKGERLKPITDKIAKPMVEVGGKPALEHILNLLKKYGIRDFVIDICYLSKTISSYFGDGSKFGVNIIYTVEKELSGTAGAIMGAKKYIDEDFIVTSGDVLRDLDVNAFINKHNESGTLATIGLFKDYQEHPRSKVVVDKDGFVIDFVEHPPESNSNGNFVWSNDSFYVFKPQIYDYISENIFVDFGKDIFPAIIKDNGKISTYIGNKYIIDIGTFEGLEKARKMFENNLL
jgi:mannose-1-phosphate guanylyltransferase/phosphomannomutase